MVLPKFQISIDCRERRRFDIQDLKIIAIAGGNIFKTNLINPENSVIAISNYKLACYIDQFTERKYIGLIS